MSGLLSLDLSYRACVALLDDNNDGVLHGEFGPLPPVFNVVSTASLLHPFWKNNQNKFTLKYDEVISLIHISLSL